MLRLFLTLGDQDAEILVRPCGSRNIGSLECVRIEGFNGHARTRPLMKAQGMRIAKQPIDFRSVNIQRLVSRLSHLDSDITVSGTHAEIGVPAMRDPESIPIGISGLLSQLMASFAPSWQSADEPCRAD